MPTVIDSLVVELGLDPKKFTQGQKDALQSFKKTQEEALKGGKVLEDQGRRHQEFMQSLSRQALTLFAALGGAGSFTGFVAGLVQSDAAVGRLSRNIGVSVPVIAQWQAVAKLVGGSAEQMAGSFVTMSDAFAGWKIGIVSPLIADFRAISTAGGTIIDVNKGVAQSFLDLSANLKAIHDRDPAQAGLLGRRAGIDPGLFDLLIRGPEATQKMLKDVGLIGGATKESADAAAKVATAWERASLAVVSLGRGITTKGEPFAEAVLNFFAKGFQGLARSVGGAPAMSSRADWQRLWGEGFVGPPMLGQGSALRTKAGAGSQSIAMAALAQSLQGSIPGLNQFTSFNDRFHTGTSSKHASGQALDFTVNDPSTAAATAAAIRAKLAAAGIDATVLDEYGNPSKRSTGGHIHVQFNSAEAAQKYADTATGLRPAGGAVSNRNSEVHINTINVNAPNATDAAGVAAGLRPILEGNSFNANANSGGE